MRSRIVGSRATEQGEVIPTWSPRVKMSKIRRLYESDARGIHDEELLDDVGYGLLCRCESFIAANEACDGKAICPCCGEFVTHQMRADENLQCSCGWRLPWRTYYKTIHPRQQLLGGGKTLIGPFGDFIRGFPKARTYRERITLIDQLIHGFHGYLESIGTDDQDVRRPTGVMLIEGKLATVVQFLNDLTYGPQSTAGLEEMRKEWLRGIDANPGWYHLQDRENNDEG